MAQVIILRGDKQRELAVQMVRSAPLDTLIRFEPVKRSTEQNSKLWAMLSDVARARPQGRAHTPEVWKCLFMHALGHEVRFTAGLDGEPFPIGFRSSRLTKTQMSDLIEFILAWGTENGVEFSDDIRPD